MTSMLRVNIKSNFISEELVPVEDHFCLSNVFNSPILRGEKKKELLIIKILKMRKTKKMIKMIKIK